MKEWIKETLASLAVLILWYAAFLTLAWGIAKIMGKV